MPVISPYKAVVTAHWKNRPLCGADFLAQIRGYLVELQSAHPAFASLFVVNGAREELAPVDPSEISFDRIVVMSLPSEWAYVNPNSTDRRFSSECTCKLGFSTGFVTDSGSEGFFVQSIIGKAIPTTSNSVLVHFPAKFNAPDVVKAIHAITTKYWRPEESGVEGEWNGAARRV